MTSENIKRFLQVSELYLRMTESSRPTVNPDDIARMTGVEPDIGSGLRWSIARNGTQVASKTR